MHEDTGEPVVVYVAPSPAVAEVVRARLESYGIPAALQYESASRLFGLYTGHLSETRVVVPPDRAEEARALLEEPDDADAQT